MWLKFIPNEVVKHPTSLWFGSFGTLAPRILVAGPRLVKLANYVALSHLNRNLTVPLSAKAGCPVLACYERELPQADRSRI